MTLLQMFVEKNILALAWIILSSYGLSLTLTNLKFSLRSWHYSITSGEDKATRITLFSHVKTHLFMVFMHTSFIVVGVITILFNADQRREFVTLAIFFAIPVTLIMISRTIRKDMVRASKYNSHRELTSEEQDLIDAPSFLSRKSDVVWTFISEFTHGKRSLL